MEQLWDAETARRYDTPGTGMFAPEVLGPTVDRLVALADGGRALEAAIGTGRVAVPLAERGVPVTGIELSRTWSSSCARRSTRTTIPVVLGDMATAPRRANSASSTWCSTRSPTCSPRRSRSMLPQRGPTPRPRRRVRHRAWVPELRKLPPGVEATVWLNEPGYIGLDTYDVLHQRVVSHHFRFDEAARPGSVAPRTGTSGRPSSTSWDRAGFALESRTPTGPARSSPPTPARTCRCTGVGERALRVGALTGADERRAVLRTRSWPVRASSSASDWTTPSRGRPGSRRASSCGQVDASRRRFPRRSSAASSGRPSSAGCRCGTSRTRGSRSSAGTSGTRCCPSTGGVATRETSCGRGCASHARSGSTASWSRARPTTSVGADHRAGGRRAAGRRDAPDRRAQASVLDRAERGRSATTGLR